MPNRRSCLVALTPLAAAMLTLSPVLVCAAEAEKAQLLPRVDVIGEVENLPTIAGTADVLGEKELEASHVFTVNEALRKVPGVHARDEEGFGLRPNIGMRGLNPTRSTKVTLLEDGIPLAYAPYGDNASYYHPQIDRYERIEVLKGAGAMFFGPQTIAGVINYITPLPPQEFGGFVQGAFGNRDYANGKIRLGGNSLMMDYNHKRGDGARDNMEHEIDDLNLKYVLPLGDNQALTLRANHFREDSVITYSGLTQAEFENFGPRYNPFENDEFEINRTGISATHELEAGAVRLLTNLYYAKFDRDWWRQSSNSQDGQHAGCNATLTIDGVTATFTAQRLAGRRVDPSTQFNCVQGRLRNYETWGLEPRLVWTHAGGEFQAGVKAHTEEQQRRQVNGNSPTARSGTLAESNLRETTAYSVFIANRFDFGQVSLTPVLRHEDVDAERRNRLTNAQGSTTVSKTMGGLGLTWNPAESLTVFSSVHQGFAPPRVEDLVGNTGTVTDVDAEESVNFELGARFQPLPGMDVQATYFRNDFDNLIAVGNIAGGSTSLSQGEALFEGVELGARAALESGAFGRLAYTWLPKAEQTEAFRRVDTGAVVGVEGNRQPYAPKNTLTAAVGYEVGAFSAELESQYVGAQYADFANTEAPSADGQRGEIKSYALWNAAFNYRFDKALSGFVTGKNLSDKTYIVDRTRGIQVGMPRLVQVGVKYAF